MSQTEDTEEVFYRALVNEEINEDGVVSNYVQDTNYHIGTSTVSRSGPLPGYRRIIATGGNATTSLSGYKVSVDRSAEANINFGIQLKTGSPTFGYRNLTVRGPVVLPDLSLNPPFDGDALATQAENQARTKFYSSLSATQSSFKGMVFAGELKEALHLIRHPASALRNGVSQYLSHIKRYGRLIPKKRRPKFVRDTWLEFAFGWRPLIADIDSAIDEFYHSRWVKPIFTMVRGSAVAGRTEAVGEGQKSLGYGFWISWYNVHTYSYAVKYYGVLTSRGNGIEDDPHTYGFSPWEFVPTIWELIPYSFLVDYFTNIGNILSSWSYRFIGCDWAARGSKASDTSSTEAVKFYYFADYYDPTLYNHWMSGDPGSFAATRARVVRDPSVSVPLPSLEVSVPGMTSQRWINIAALSKQLKLARASMAR